jgi:beta-mannosidase
MRTQYKLREGWAIIQLDGDHPDVTALTQAVIELGDDWLVATMPAQVHDVLLAYGLIPDPRVSRNAAQSAWVGERDWVYACTFPSPAGEGPVYLRFQGLDTLATVYLNGDEIGRFENMHRHYAVEVRGILRPPEESNVLLVVFASALRYVESVPERFGHQEGVEPYHYLRKCRSDFTSYLGARPHSVKVGVFDDVILDVPDRAWLEDVHVRSELSPDLAYAQVRIAFQAAGEAAQVSWMLVDPGGDPIARESVETWEGNFEIGLDDPQLWWPRTHGTPHLYALRLDLTLDGIVRDSRTMSFGLRRIRSVLADAETGESRFAFEVNGQRIFLRGACWAPLEGMTHCWSQERAERLLDLVEQGRMNVLRVWGGGTVPPQAFYDACDRRGILVWQDFMFGYGKYPAGLPTFDENCRREIEDVVRRLRNHACLLLWCGGNENHMGWDFQVGTPAAEGWELFEQTMPEVCAALDPDRFYHPSSPYGGCVPNWPLEGDWHDYTTVSYSPQASVPLYASEVGRVSAPSAASMRRFLSEEELWPEGHDARIRTPGAPAWPEMWQYRSVDGSWDKVGPIEAFCDPASPEDLVRVLGTAHGEYLRERVERHRRGVPDGAPDGNRRCWGNTIWRLNDSWPILYWSAVDYYLEPKIPYYFLRRAYAPVLVSFERTADSISVWVVNDSPAPVAGPLTLRRMRFDGRVLGELSCLVEIEPGEARRCLDATDLGPIRLREEFLWAELDGNQATYTLIGERYLHLPQATLAVRCAGDLLHLSTDVYARQVALEVPSAVGAVFEDNFFDLAPGQSRTIQVIESAGGDRLCVRALNAQSVQVAI